jgi:hypothetical protein
MQGRSLAAKIESLAATGQTLSKQVSEWSRDSQHTEHRPRNPTTQRRVLLGHAQPLGGDARAAWALTATVAPDGSACRHGANSVDGRHPEALCPW